MKITNTNCSVCKRDNRSDEKTCWSCGIKNPIYIDPSISSALKTMETKAPLNWLIMESLSAHIAAASAQIAAAGGNYTARPTR